MGFATVADVERYQPGRAPFSSQTKPTASAVGDLCLDMTAQLTGDLAAVGFDVTGFPTGIPSVAQRQLQSVAAKMVANEVEKVAVNSSADTRKHYQKMADEAERSLMEGGPYGMEPSTGSGKPSFSAAASTRALFNRDMLL